MYKFLELLNRLPWRSPFGLPLGDFLKEYHYNHKNKEKCLCGGRILESAIFSRGGDEYGYEIYCSKCEFLFRED